MVGFSLGGILSIDFATHNSVSGILSISTFFVYKYHLLFSVFLNVAKLFSNLKFKRHLHTTTRHTRSEITMTPYLPVKACAKILKEGDRALQRVHMLRCPLLLLHSLDDNVASYSAVAEASRTCGSAKCNLVTLRYLDHFLQFDIPPAAIRALTLNFFQLEDSKKGSVPPPNMLTEIFLQCREESRHWAGIVFRLVIGFFSVFGALIYFTLPEIIQQTPKAPYFLVAYSIAINMYLLLFLLYFFYLNRVDVYLKNHIEPQIKGFPWTTFRTLKWASGKTTNMTNFVSVPIFAVPFIASFGVILYCLTFYSELFLAPALDSVLLKASILVASVLWLYAASSAYSLARYTYLELRKTVRAKSSNPDFEALLYQLYNSITPGLVKQPATNIDT